MKEISKEIIEIDGQEYTLFLNRKGIVAFEKYSGEEHKKIQELYDKYKNIDEDKLDIIEKTQELNDETNPFGELEIVEDYSGFIDYTRNCYIKLYWIMLYTNHQLSLSKVKDLYVKACEEYGEEQIRALGDQMIEEVNAQPTLQAKGELKNLKALKPKK